MAGLLMRAPHPPKAAFIYKGGVRSIRAAPAWMVAELVTSGWVQAINTEIVVRMSSRADKKVEITTALLLEPGDDCQAPVRKLVVLWTASERSVLELHSCNRATTNIFTPNSEWQAISRNYALAMGGEGALTTSWRVQDCLNAPISYHSL
jgi:hypothetical protein